MMCRSAAATLLVLLAACESDRLGGSRPGRSDASSASDAARADAIAADVEVDAGVVAAPDATPEDKGFPDAVAELDARAPDATEPDSGPPLPDGGPPQCPIQPTAREVGAHRSALPALSWWGAGYTIAIDEVVSEQPFVLEVKLEKTDAQGRLLQGPVSFSPEDGETSFWPRIAFSGLEYGVTYLNGSARRATFQRGDAALRPIPGSIVTLGASGQQTGVAVAWSNGTWGVAWSEDSGGIGLQRFDASGAAIGSVVDVGPGYISDNGQPMIATAAGWAIASTGGGNANIYEIDRNGVVRSIPLPFAATRIAIASDGTQYMVVRGDSGGNYARVPIGGTAASTWSTLGGPRAQVPNVIWTGTQFIAAWSETYSGIPVPLLRAVLPSTGAAGPITGTPFTTESNAGFANMLAGSCGWAIVYGTFTQGDFETLEVHP